MSNDNENFEIAKKHFARANECLENSDWDGAIIQLDQVIHLAPARSNAWYNRGIVWWEKGEEYKAIADFSEAIRLKPDHVGSWNNRGIVWEKKGEYDKAIADFDEAIRLVPSNQYIIHNRNRTMIVSGKAN